MLNQLYNFSLILGFGCISLKAYSITNSSLDFPGIIESTEKLQQLNVDQLSRTKSILNNKIEPDFKLDDADEIRIDSQFMRSILFQNDSKYLTLINKDECKLYSILENNLIPQVSEEEDAVYLTVKTKAGIVKSLKLSKEQFFIELYKRKCFNNKEFNILFNDKNFQKTILGIKFSTPKGENDCKSIHEEWILNSYTPYLCVFNQQVKKYKQLPVQNLTIKDIELKKQVESYLTKIPLLQRNYIESLCNNLDDSKAFCANYLKPDVWNKVINGEKASYKLNFKCQNYLNKTTSLTLKEQQLCANKFIADSKICNTIQRKDFPTYFPLQNCDETSTALNISKLQSNYLDCPGNIDNEAITNIHRIINHFSPREIINSPESCAAEANYSFARLNLDIKYEKGWPLKICYLNRVDNKEDCTPYIPGSRENEPLSEDQVISKILYLQKGAPAKVKCSIVSTKKYNPIRTEFKSGCFIVYNPETCTTLACEKKVIWENNIQADIKFIGTPIFEYYPASFSNERYSVQSLLNEVKGIQSRAVKSLTELRFYMDKIPSSIIHGIGCAEDLIPENFNRVVLNQCKPLPFIISGYYLKNGETIVIVHTAIDELYSPRQLTWQSVYNSVSAYKELHPLDTWTLNGLKK